MADDVKQKDKSEGGENPLAGTFGRSKDLASPEQPFAGHPRPTLGRMIRYVLGDKSPNAGEERAAIIALVHDPVAGQPDLLRINLTFFTGKKNDAVTGLAVSWFEQGVKYDPSGAPGTWHWPEGTGEAKAAAGAGKSR